ncbi:LysR family transcriptional regulator [Paraburkholderia tropica]|uniref:LysR family transcriptional regulator n=1 Tax=Paraburkholderia tropica TaxID=92647 RepID=UPI0038BBA790
MPVRSLPPLSALRAFESTARNQSVTKAAGELCRTHGAVSRQLKLLQSHIGAPLFSREGTGIRLNQTGHALYLLASSVFEQLEHGYARVRDQARQSGLHVACSATFAMRWLVPNLADFYRAEPDIRIRLSMTSAREIRTEGADLVIAWDLTSYSESDRERAIRLAPVSSDRCVRRLMRQQRATAFASATSSQPTRGRIGTSCARSASETVVK